MANNLLRELAQATGLPEQLVQRELEELIHTAGITEKDLDMDGLREVLASYAQDVLLTAKESYEKKASNS